MTTDDAVALVALFWLLVGVVLTSVSEEGSLGELVGGLLLCGTGLAYAAYVVAVLWHLRLP
ncbi:MAG: hypothetical protein KAJ19_21760 [Gammaproteobacteria bacterium]|nr:hypothetical protein [Gammaproteobacteria bacterium]